MKGNADLIQLPQPTSENRNHDAAATGMRYKSSTRELTLASNFVLKFDFNCCMHLVLCLHGRNKQVRETIQRGTLRLRFTSCGLAGALPLRKDPFSSTVIGVGTSPINFNPRKNCYFKFSILASLDLRPCVCVCEGPSLEKQIWIHSAACMASSVQPVGAAKGCNAKWQKSLLIRVKFFGILCC